MHEILLIDWLQIKVKTCNFLFLNLFQFIPIYSKVIEAYLNDGFLQIVVLIFP